MKKIILLFFFFTVFTNITYAKVITLSNCGKYNKVLIKEGMNKNEFTKNEYIIDTDKKFVRFTDILTDSFFKKQKEIILNAKQINSREYEIIYSDSKFVQAKRDLPIISGKNTLEINLNEKTITSTIETQGKVVRNFVYCDGGGGSKDFLNKIIGK
jgi:hypothetical protein